ncbi:MAG: DUF3822 family protein [Bacteroidales bacterium]|nr:DUF3822 family protein [Bacteroidales bacterium]
MQADSVISNSITQDIRLKGHQSIRFTPDGFSVLVSDASFTPVYLKNFHLGPDTGSDELLAACGRILDEEELLSMEGETVLITDSMAVTLIPTQFHHPERNREILERICTIEDGSQLQEQYLKARKSYLIYAVPEKIMELSRRVAGEVKILHSSECLISLSDQVRSSDHQRGFVMAEVQAYSLDILVIIQDRIQLLNRYSLTDPSDFIYFTLNTMKQLNLDHESIPVYISGIVHEEHPLHGLLRKYIRNVVHTPYYLENLSKAETLRYMILSEGSKCA